MRGSDINYGFPTDWKSSGWWGAHVIPLAGNREWKILKHTALSY